MLDWQTVKEFFGFGGNAVEETATMDVSRPIQAAPTLRVIEPVTVRQPQISLKKAQVRKAKTNPKNYYRRGGRYYSTTDDSLIEDLMLLYILSELFSEDEVAQYNDGEFPAREVTEDLQDIDVSSTPVVAVETISTAKPSYTPPEPEPTRYDSGSSYSSGSSDYGSSDSGSSDSGGGYD